MNIFPEKEYDADKHCGVWIPELERNCTRSLTCKVSRCTFKYFCQLEGFFPSVNLNKHGDHASWKT